MLTGKLGLSCAVIATMPVMTLCGRYSTNVLCGTVRFKLRFFFSKAPLLCLVFDEPTLFETVARGITASDGVDMMLIVYRSLLLVVWTLSNKLRVGRSIISWVVIYFSSFCFEHAELLVYFFASHWIFIRITLKHAQFPFSIVAALTCWCLFYQKVFASVFGDASPVLPQ